MNRLSSPSPSRVAGFTLIELLLVIVIVAILASMMIPVVQQQIAKARQVACLSNLRRVGEATLTYAGDNNNKLPKIETDPSDPVYPAEDNVKGLLETLAPYGLSEINVKCPDDLSGLNYFESTGSSYEWSPIFDGESVMNPTLQLGEITLNVPLTHLRLAMDFERVHRNRRNILFGDGQVRFQ